MNDTTEMWRDFKIMKQGQRTQRRENAPEVLRANGVFFTEHNHGAHLIIETPMGYVDYWPGTSRWKNRALARPVAGFGIATLLHYIKPEFVK